VQPVSQQYLYSTERPATSDDAVLPFHQAPLPLPENSTMLPATSSTRGCQKGLLRMQTDVEFRLVFTQMPSQEW
jgi:hypothetical protein